MTNVSKFYHDVIDDVISGVKEIFNDEGVDMQVLEELKKTHVFDPEPATNTAAQYLNLVQRSQSHTIPNATGVTLSLANSAVGVPVRQIGSVIRAAGTAESTAMGLAVPGSLASLRVPVPRLNPVTLTGRPIRPLEAGQQQQPQQIPGTVTSLILPAQTQLGKPQNANVVSGIVNPNAANIQAGRTMTATAIPANAAPQLATLPSGLTGHLVQIGQQTFLVPQPLTATAVRQPGMHFTVPQFMSNPPAAQTAQLTDISQFKQTQVDGGNDSDDDKFCDTPASQPPSVRGHQKHSSRSHFGDTNTPQVHGYDLDDDDDDDDDLVPATPGLTPPSSVRSHYHHGRHNLDTPSNADVGDATPLPSAPPTPMSPPSVSGTLRQGKGSIVRRPGTESSSNNQGANLKRRRQRSPYPGGGDTETEVDDDDDGDFNEATPSGQHLDEDDDDARNLEGHYGQPRKTKSKTNQNAPMTGTATSTGSHSKSHEHHSNQLTSPTNLHSPDSESGVPAPVEPDEEVDMLKNEQEEEEEEEPLNSEDDVSDEEPEILFESDNVVVCQYDKIHRSRNKWRFYLKDGIMSINGRDYVFQKALGEADW